MIEHAVTTAESWESRLVAIPFIIGIIVFWAFTIWSRIGFAVLFDGFAAVFVATFAFAYFFFFHVSKLFYKTTNEEVSDDTSMFALFSANRRKEQRSFFSIVFAVFHTIVLIAYMISNDIGMPNVDH